MQDRVSCHKRSSSEKSGLYDICKQLAIDIKTIINWKRTLTYKYYGLCIYQK